MLKEIYNFVIKLIIFGIGFFAINTVIDFLSSVVVYSHSLRSVALALWAFIPGLYLIKCGIELYLELQENKV